MISATRYRATVEIARQSRLAQDIARLQSDISTGKRIERPSDDPAAAARASQIRRTQSDQAVWMNNIEAASNVANQVDTTLTSVAIAIDRVRELLLSANSSTLSNDDRTAIALELRGIAENVDNYATDFDSTGKPLFPDGDPLEVTISGAVRVAATLSRDAVFEGIDTAGGPMELSQIIRAAADAAEIADPAARQTALTASLADADDARIHVSGARASHGVRAARIDAAREALETIGLRLEEERSGLESTDVAEAVTKLNAKLLSLEAARAAFARVNRQTLFDLLG